MLTYKEHFSSNRPDGRHVCTMAAQMEMFRHMKQEWVEMEVVRL